MRVIGFNFNKIEAERKESKKGNLKVNSNINIDSVEEENISLMENKQSLRFNFNFSIDYNPKIASIKIKGYLIGILDKKNAKDIKEDWEEDKKLPGDIKKLVLNHILKKCNLKALELEDEFGLPTHIPMPKLKSKKSSNSKK